MLFVTRFSIETVHAAAARIIGEQGIRPGARKAGVSTGTLRNAVDTKDITVSSAAALLDEVGLELRVEPKGRIKYGHSPTGFAEEVAAYQAQSNIKDEALGAGYVPLQWHHQLELPPGPFPVAVSVEWVKERGWDIQNLAGVLLGDQDNASGWAPGTPLLLDLHSAQPEGQLVAYLDRSRVHVAHYHQAASGRTILTPTIPSIAPLIVQSIDAADRSEVIILGSVKWVGVGV